MARPDDMGRGPDVVDGVLPLPTEDADEAVAQVRSLINRLDELIVARADERGARLHMWTGPARDEWDLDFNLTQVELQTVIDRLQPFAGDVEDMLDSIRDHNQRVVAAVFGEGGDGGGGGSGGGSW
jgi:hypothetical protein